MQKLPEWQGRAVDWISAAAAAAFLPLLLVVVVWRRWGKPGWGGLASHAILWSAVWLAAALFAVDFVRWLAELFA